MITETLEKVLERALADSESYLAPPGIMRYDHVHTHGWWVRVMRKGKNYRTFFSDGQHGSIENALAEAIKHWHELKTKLEGQKIFLGSRAIPNDPEGRINRQVDPPKGNGAPYEYWLARWYDSNHKKIYKRFSVRKHGENQAKAMALAATIKNHNTNPKVSAALNNREQAEWKPYNRLDTETASRINTPQKAIARNRVEITDPHAFEGTRKFELHLSIERDPNIRRLKLADFLSTNGKLSCEICGFSFIEKYPFLKKDIIEVHHVTPLSQLTKRTVTTLNDLMLLCSNCHFAVHQGDAVENVIFALDCVQNGC